MSNKSSIFINLWEQLNEEDVDFFKINLKLMPNKTTKKNIKKMLTWLGSENGQQFLKKVDEIDYIEQCNNVEKRYIR